MVPAAARPREGGGTDGNAERQRSLSDRTEECGRGSRVTPPVATQDGLVILEAGGQHSDHRAWAYCMLYTNIHTQTHIYVCVCVSLTACVCVRACACVLGEKRQVVSLRTESPKRSSIEVDVCAGTEGCHALLQQEDEAARGALVKE